jgi:hypothetical protein
MGGGCSGPGLGPVPIVLVFLNAAREGATADGQKPLAQLGSARDLGRVPLMLPRESGARKVLAEGPHSEIAEDPERRWTEDLRRSGHAGA